MRFFIILSLAVIATASPARNLSNEENAKAETVQFIGDSKVEVSFEKTKNGLPKIIVDVKDKRQDEDKDLIAEELVEDLKARKGDMGVKESREVEADKVDLKGESRSTIHVHTPSAPQINIAPASHNIAPPNRYPMPTQSRPGQGQAGSYGQLQATTYDSNYNRKKENRDKPYNQVNVYVYFPKDMSMMNDEDTEMSVNQYNYNDGTSSSTVVSNSLRQQQKKPECPVGFAKIKGVCLEIDSRKKRTL